MINLYGTGDKVGLSLWSIKFFTNELDQTCFENSSKLRCWNRQSQMDLVFEVP